VQRGLLLLRQALDAIVDARCADGFDRMCPRDHELGGEPFADRTASADKRGSIC